jgi:hypothetical protein
VVLVSYCAYSSTARRLTRNGVYCLSSGTGYCIDEVVVLSAGRLVHVSVDVPDGDKCATYPVKFDSTNKRLVRSSGQVTCYGYGI